MAKTAVTRARIEPEVKAAAEKIFSECGMNASQAIGFFYRQVILERGMPFQVRTFNAKTLKVLRDSERGIEVQRFNSAEELFENLGL